MNIKNVVKVMNFHALVRVDRAKREAQKYMLMSGELYQMLDELNQKEGLAILMVSHDLDHVLKHAREILLLDGGVRFYGTVSEYENSASGRMMTEGGNRT